MAAEEPKGGGPGQDALVLFGILAALALAWYASGGASKTDFRGLFLSPPQPLGTGDAYGPQVGTTSDAVLEQQQQYQNNQVEPPPQVPGPDQYQY